MNCIVDLQEILQQKRRWKHANGFLTIPPQYFFAFQLQLLIALMKTVVRVTTQRGRAADDTED